MIIATAGHVDHGKTSLVKNLTGIDTDRLAEEKRRGLSINLGFAYQTVADSGNSQRLGFIDVPGHSRFINTMIAGVTGIDLAMIVVAADEGPMPQTLEHIDVMNLLGVSNYLLVITHIDKANQQQIDAVAESMLARLNQINSSIAVPVFTVNNLNRDGVAELKTYLENLAKTHKLRSAHGFFRMSIDRAFTLKGIGLIVTGTALSGTIKSGDSLQLLPLRQAVRIRSIRAEDEAVDIAHAGQRCALNIVGDIEKHQVKRGDWLIDKNAGPSSHRIDAQVELLTSAPFSIKHLSPIKLHLEAKLISAKLFLLGDKHESNKLVAGDSSLAQLIIDGEIVCCRGDRFLIRDDSESVTLGGGIILDPWAPKTGKSSSERLEYLAAMTKNSFTVAVQFLLDKQLLLDLSKLRLAWNLKPPEAEKLLLNSGITQYTVLINSEERQFLLTNEYQKELETQLIQQLSHWHTAKPTAKGFPVAQLQHAFSAHITVNLFKALLVPLLKNNTITLVNGLVSIARHQPTMPDEFTRQWLLIENFLAEPNNQLSTIGDLQIALDLEKKQCNSLINQAKRNQQLIQIGERRYVLPKVMHALAEAVNNLAADNKPFSVVDCKNHLNLGRTPTIELLEYFDSIRFTERQGNNRIVLNANVPARHFLDRNKTHS